MVMLTNHRNLHDDNYDDNQVDDNVDNHDDTTQPSYYLQNVQHRVTHHFLPSRHWRGDAVTRWHK